MCRSAPLSRLVVEDLTIYFGAGVVPGVDQIFGSEGRVGGEKYLSVAPWRRAFSSSQTGIRVRTMQG